MRHRSAALLLSLALSTTAALLPSPARAEVDGVDVKMTKLPGEFEAGDDPEVVEAVVSTDNGGGCQKVRWSMVMTLAGIALDDVKVERIEDDGAFPLQVRTEGSTARLTDVQLDPGQLCRGRTVTARYEVKFDEGSPAGEVAFNAQAFDAGRKLLAQTSATSKVDGEEAPPPATEAPATEKPAPAESAPAQDESEAAAIPPPADGSGVALNPASDTKGSTPSMLGPGLIVGAVLVFAGVGLLMRLRKRNRKSPQMPQRYPGYTGM